MDINLLDPHNREAYQKVMQHFNDGHQKACIEHPTASGKSYVITAVSDNFRRVLIVAPGTFVLEQVKSTIESESPEREIAPDYMTYAAIMKGKQVGTDYSNLYDLIVLDEYHHLGAEAWGAGIEYICGQNPNAKILGTTASPIRYSDKKRNMSDIFFKGNVLSRIDLGAAWARKILISPVYIMAIEDSDEFHNKFIRDIENSSLLEEKKQSFIQLVRAAKDKYEMNHTAPGIIEKHLLPDSRRVIVFSKDIEEAAENERKVRQWLLTADFTVAESYTLVSTDSDAVKKSKMADFQNDDFTGVKLMVAVDMLNEGVHVPRVDAVFFLRKTQSPSIHLQQMGRCMNRYKENARKPVIFDFRNNIINTMKCSVNDMFAKEMKSYDKELCKKKGKKVKSDTVDTEPKSVIDAEEFENLPTGINYCMDTSLLYERFKQDVKWQGKWSLLEEYVGVAEIYYKQHNKRIPVTGGYVNVCCSLNKFLRDEKRQAERPELVERLRNCGFEKDKLIMKYALIAEDYYIKHGKKIPTKDEYENVCGSLNRFWRNKERRAENPDVVEILQRSGFVDKVRDLLIKYALVAEEYYKRYGKKIPGDREYKNIYSRLMYFWRDKKRRAERPNIVEILSRSGFKDK